jgi:glutamate dehydrogenase (NAD(P)+)
VVTNRLLLSVVEKLTGRSVDADERQLILKGPQEIDYVYSALADTMAFSYQRIREAWKTRGHADLRTTAFYLAVDRIARSYLALGIFP